MGYDTVMDPQIISATALLVAIVLMVAALIFVVGACIRYRSIASQASQFVRPLIYGSLFSLVIGGLLPYVTHLGLKLPWGGGEISVSTTVFTDPEYKPEGDKLSAGIQTGRDWQPIPKHFWLDELPSLPDKPSSNVRSSK